MAMQRGPQMPIGKLKSPGVFGQQEKPAEPSWRAAAPGGTKFNVNKPATGPTVSATSPVAPSTVSSVSSPTTQAQPAETASPPPTATSPAPSVANKLNLSKFQQAPKASPFAALTTVAAAAAVTSSGSLPSNNKSAATSTSSNAPATSPVSSVSSPTTQAPPAETASPPPTATSPAPSAANKLNLSKFQQAPKECGLPNSLPSLTVAPKPNVPSPSLVATPSTAASSAGTPTAATATTTTAAAVPAPKTEVPSPTAPVAVTNRVIPTRPSATVNGGQSSGTPSPAINTPSPVSSPSLPAASTVKPAETVLRAPVAVAPDTIVRASAQTAQSAPTSISATPSPAAATTQPASPAAHQPDKPKCPPDVVLDPPSELRFRGSYSDGITTRLRLTNKSTESRICFKVKTNVPLYYSVQPSIDLIEPLQHVDVAVHLQATSGGRPDVDGQHKFMVQSIHAPDGEIASLDRLWQQARPQEITSSKLVCFFEQVVEIRPVKRSSGVFNGIETSQVTQPKKRDSKPVQQTTKSSSGILWVLVLAVVVAVIAVAVYQSSLK